MERLAKKLAHTIAISQGYNKEREAVVEYGLIALFQMSMIACVIAFFGLLFGIAYESILIFIGVGLLRKATGGAHSNSINRCMATSCLNILILAYLSKLLVTIAPHSWSFLCILLLGFLWCFIIISMKAPVDSPRKPITSQEKIKRLRRQSVWTITIYFLLFLLLWFCGQYTPHFQSLAVSLCLLSLWQCFTLTMLGHRLINKIDQI